MEDQLYFWKIKYHWKINCCVGRYTVLLEDKLYHWKINCDVGRSGVFSEDAVMKTINRKITVRRWLHKYVGAECGASSFTWYLYQMCNTDVRLLHLFDYVPILVSSWICQELLPMTKVMSMQKDRVRGQRSILQRSIPNLAVSGL